MALPHQNLQQSLQPQFPILLMVLTKSGLLPYGLRGITEVQVPIIVVRLQITVVSIVYILINLVFIRSIAMLIPDAILGLSAASQGSPNNLKPNFC